MTALKLAFLELRRFRGPLRVTVPVLLVLIPSLYGAMYLWANWEPYQKLDHVPVAVVNHDQPAHTREGKRVDAGAQFVAQLKEEGTFDWHFVPAHRARSGLEQGDYYFTITVPRDFSSRLASAGTTHPERAGIDIELNDANNYIAGIMTKVIQPELQSQVNSAAHAAYVRAIYGKLSEVRKRLKTASDGAHRLVHATTLGKQASATLTTGLGSLHAGTSRIARGAKQIAGASKRLDTTTSELTHTIASTLPGAAATLVNTAGVADRGLSTAHAGTRHIEQHTARAVGQLTRLADAHPELRNDPAYTRALRDARKLDATAGTVNGNVAAAAGNAHRTLRRAQSIQTQIGTAQQRVLATAKPIRLVDAGSHSVSTGASRLAHGVGTLKHSARTTRTAAKQAHSAASELSHTIDKSRRQIPPTTPDEVAHAAKVLGTPVHINRHNLHPAGVYGRGFAPFFFGIALWVFGLFAYLLLRPLNLRALASRARAPTVALAGWLPGAALGVAGALVLYGIVDAGLGLDPLHAGLTVLLLAVGAASFVAIDHFLRTAFGAPGDVLSLVLLILQLTSSGGLYPMPTTPSFFQALNPILPMTYLIDGLRVTISGGLPTHLLRDLLVLAGFGLAFLALTSLAAWRQRTWTVGRLHPDVEL
jgi:putative membrane protein